MGAFEAPPNRTTFLSTRQSHRTRVGQPTNFLGFAQDSSDKASDKSRTRAEKCPIEHRTKLQEIWTNLEFSRKRAVLHRTGIGQGLEALDPDRDALRAFAVTRAATWTPRLLARAFRAAGAGDRDPRF